MTLGVEHEKDILQHGIFQGRETRLGGSIWA